MAQDAQDKLLAGTHEHALQKREQMLEKLSKNKWWNKGYDPRPAHPDDNIRIMGKANLIVKFKDEQAFEEFCTAVPEFDPERFPSALRSGIMLQPGFHMLYQNPQDPYKSDIFVQMFGGGAIRVPQDIANQAIKRPNMAYIEDYHTTERANPIEAEQTNLEAFAEFFEEDDMDDPRLVLAYTWLAGMFQHGNLDSSDRHIIKEALSFVEWQRRHQPAVDEDVFAGFDFSAPNRHMNLHKLEEWYNKLSNEGLDPETNKVTWGETPVWEGSGYEVSPLETTEDAFMSHGALIGHCVDQIEDQPYFSMQREDHWNHYALRDKTGRPCATVCIHEGREMWTILENKGKGSVNLHPGAEKVEGKQIKHQEMIDRWLKSVEARGIAIDRTSENKHAPSVHPEFGLPRFGYHPEFSGQLIEDDPYEWEVEERSMANGRLGEIYPENLNDLQDYFIELRDHPHHFLESEREQDYENRVQYYHPGNTINMRNSDLENIVTEICDMEPSIRSEKYVQDIIFQLNVFLEHESQMSGHDHRDINMDELVEHVRELGSDEVADNLSIRRAHQRTPITREDGQMDLGFDENDIAEWPARVADMLEKSNEFHWAIDLPHEDNEYTNFNLALLREQFDAKMRNEIELNSKPNLEKLDKTNPHAAQKELFVPIMEGDSIAVPHLNNDKISQDRSTRWRKFHEDKIRYDHENKELIREGPQYDLMGWEPTQEDIDVAPPSVSDDTGL